ncbi:MAG: hypothetical protein VB042_09855 [Victivallaceae bacterium]|nr:hypothetical protein [Victivallaceae bacterium]
MLKLNASYSKKVPAEGEYSSQSYHASIEVELPDGLSPEQLRGRIHETFQTVRDSVEAELNGKTSVNHGGNSAQNTPKPLPQTGYSQSGLASGKQLKYLLDLARAKGVTPQQIAGQFNVPDIRQLTRNQCSQIIKDWRAA